MSNRLTFIICAAVAIGITGAASRSAFSGAQGVAMVRLQSGFPGAAQTGNANISGTLRAGKIDLDSASTSLQIHTSGSNSIIAVSDASSTPTIYGAATNSGNAAVWGRNTSTGVHGFLGYGLAGVYGEDGGNPAFSAGYFYGQLQVGGPRANIKTNGALGFAGTYGSAPASTFIGSPTSDSLGFFTGDTERIRVDAAGNVGIGTSSPEANLHLNGSMLMPNGGILLAKTNSGITETVFWPRATDNSTILNYGQAGMSFRNAGAEKVWFSAAGYAQFANTVAANNLQATNSVYGATVQGQNYVYGGNAGGTIRSEFWSGSQSNAIAAFNNSLSDNYPTLYCSNNGGFFRAGYFNGNLAATSKSFLIDHPLDPANKYLEHSCVESDDRRNLYDGTVTLDSTGEATITMPEWFESLNHEFRYQLTAIGGPGRDLYIAEEIKNNQFKIAGGSPGLKVSWMVTGVRQDPYAKAHPMQVEVDKGDQRGKYLMPELYGMPASAGGAMQGGPAPVPPKKQKQ